MKFSHVLDIEKRKEEDLLVLPYWKRDKDAYPAFSFQPPYSSVIEDVLSTHDFKGKEGEFLLLYVQGGVEKRLCLLGLGEKEKVSAEGFRRSYGALTRACLSKQFKSMNLVVPETDKIDAKVLFKSVSEGVLLPNYLFNRHKNREAGESEGSLLESISWISSYKQTLDIAQHVLISCEAVYYARDLINESADIVTPEYLGECAKEIAKKQKGVKATVFSKKQIEKEKLELLLAVNRGSALDPAFIILDYQGDPGNKDKTVLVGKGVTYDTGGLNLKPTGSMESMKCDMSGAAVCLGVIQAASQLKLQVNVTAVIPTTENGIDAKSFKPGDVYSSYSGKTVEMTNSDAEGRLILADALAYTVKNLSPTRVIDIATLTGAIEVALGSEASGVMGTDDQLVQDLVSAGNNVFERLWRMPLFDEYKERLKSDIADLKSWNGRPAGANVAATFLQQFVGDTVPWAHIDIAATAYVSEAGKYFPKGGTGFGVRLLIEFLDAL